MGRRSWRTSSSTAFWGLASRASPRRAPSTSCRRRKTELAKAVQVASGITGESGTWWQLVAVGWRFRRGSGFSKTFGIFLAVHNDETSQITMGGWAEEHLEEEAASETGGHGVS